MRQFLLSALAFIALPAFAQQTDYRISEKVSMDCGKEILYHYDNNVTSNPSAITEIIDLWSIENIDSLYYDSNGNLIKRDSYEVYEGGTPKYLSSSEYTYMDNGQMESSVHYEMDGDEKHTEYYIYSYDNNNRLTKWELQEDNVLEEKCEYTYDEAGLLTQKLYFEDYGWGFTSYQKVKYFYEDGKLTKEEYHYYMEDNEWHLYTYCEYAYENDNCLSNTTYYDGSVYTKEEYLHNPEISIESVYSFSAPSKDPMPTPKHVNIIVGHNEYAPNYTSGDLELACSYGYSYDEFTLSVKEDNTLSFNVYPNPVKDIINIEAENIDLVEIYDIYGRRHNMTYVNGNNIQIEINDLSEGIYFVKIYSEGNSSVKKIVK